MKELKYLIDLDITRKRQQRAVATYDEAAVVQREVTDRLFERLEYMLIQPTTILELGQHVGYGTEKLRKLYPQASLHSQNLVDIYDPQTHALRLPFDNASQSMVIANLVLHWYVEPIAFLQEIRRVLKSDGVLLFSTMGPDTLRELRSAFAQIDHTPHVHEFLDMHDLGDQLQALGFIDPVVDMHSLRVKYADVLDLFKDLRHLGANNAHLDRQRGLMGKNKWQKLIQAYREQTEIVATYELVFGLAWGIRQISRDGEVSIPLSSIKSR